MPLSFLIDLTAEKFKFNFFDFLRAIASNRKRL